jgi:hypothetical protein
LIELRVNSGLCNRMRAIASGLALARASGQPLTVYWLRTSALNCAFGRLFEPLAGAEVVDIRTTRFKLALGGGARRMRAAHKRMPFDLFLSTDKIDEFNEQGIDLAEPVSQARRCGIETYAPFYVDTASYSDFIPRRDILAEADKTLAGLGVAGGGDRLVGVHIRRGDNSASIAVSPLDTFIERMQREVDEHPQTWFFLATDDPASEQAVQKAFPGRVTARSKHLARDRTRGVRDALVDLLVLSHCPLILGSYWSSFSQTAREMGEGTLEVMVAPKYRSVSDG